MSTAEVSSFLDGWWEASRVGAGEQAVAGRRKRRVLARVRRAAWRLEQAERERAWAVVTAHAEGASIREVGVPVRNVSPAANEYEQGASDGKSPMTS